MGPTHSVLHFLALIPSLPFPRSLWWCNAVYFHILYGFVPHDDAVRGSISTLSFTHSFTHSKSHSLAQSVSASFTRSIARPLSISFVLSLCAVDIWYFVFCRNVPAEWGSSGVLQIVFQSVYSLAVLPSFSHFEFG